MPMQRYVQPHCIVLISHYSTQRFEVQRIMKKYSQASQFLSGIGLNPDAYPDTYYPPFNDTQITRYFRNSSSLLVTPLSYDAMDVDSGYSPIIGLPQTNYTDFHLMPLKDDVKGGMDISYYGPVQFGTPKQELTVSVDTGSADLWIPVNCPSCSNAQFSSAASSTFRNSKRKVSLVYVCGSFPLKCLVRPDLLLGRRQRFWDSGSRYCHSRYAIG
jgi:hypothetical protein